MTGQREGLEELWWRLGPHCSGRSHLMVLQKVCKFRILVEDPQDFGLSAGAPGFWEDSTAISVPCEPKQVPPPWAASSLKVQCKGQAKDAWGVGSGGGKAQRDLYPTENPDLVDHLSQDPGRFLPALAPSPPGLEPQRQNDHRIIAQTRTPKKMKWSTTDDCTRTTSIWPLHSKATSSSYT